MSTISVPAFTRKLREVVADEPKAFAYDLGLSLSAVYNYLNGRVPRRRSCSASPATPGAPWSGSWSRKRARRRR
jgi:hypothetical protein